MFFLVLVSYITKTDSTLRLSLTYPHNPGRILVGGHPINKTESLGKFHNVVDSNQRQSQQPPSKSVLNPKYIA